MTTFAIYSIAGVSLGRYEAPDPETAARMMRADAGYSSDEHAAEVLGCTVDELNDELEIVSVHTTLV